MKHFATEAITKFQCLQVDCPDACCKGWSMQVDDLTFAKYKGTELEKAVAYDGQNGEIRVMKRDDKTDFCIKFTAGKCAIHASKGAEMLSDACNFYPRITRQIGDDVIMTATLSCPEIARLMLFEEGSFAEVEKQTERLPTTLKNYAPEDLSGNDIRQINNIFLDACVDSSISPERLVARIYSAATSLQYIEQKEWKNATGFMLRMADGKLSEASLDKLDFYKILQNFAGIIHAIRKSHNERLTQTLNEIEIAVGVAIDWQTLDLQPINPQALDWTIAKWKKNEARFAPVLRKFVQSQLSFSTFPFAGLGADITEKAKLLSFRFALTKLALMALPNDADENEIIRSIQSIARVLDHLADATLTMNLFEQAGWKTGAKIRGLIGDF